MGWSDEDFCIKCDRGGNVLVCSNSGCPLAVHEKCLGFPTKFNEMGKFYCPYCIYRRLVEESHHAREKALSRKKALSIFLDTKLINGDCQRPEFENFKLKETTQLLDAGKINDPHIENDENLLNKVNVPKNSVPDKESEQQDRFAHECSKGVSRSKDADILFLGIQSDSFPSKYSNIARASDHNHRLVVVGHRTVSGPIVAYGKDYVGSEDEETAQRFEMVEIGNRIPLQHQQQNDGHQPRRCLKNQLEENHLLDPLVTEKQRKEDILSKARKVGNEAGTIQENVGNKGGTEEVEEQLDKTAALPNGEPALQVHLLEKRGFEASGLTGTDSRTVLNGKRVKYNDKSSDEGTDADCFREPSRDSASALRAYVDHLEKIVASSSSRQLTEPASTNNLFPNGRRKRLPWTDEEANMLKEGVRKFSTDMNKNIPWSKILEFGRHVFHGTRTPVDLKDKWRNMLAKER